MYKKKKASVNMIVVCVYMNLVCVFGYYGHGCVKECSKFCNKSRDCNHVSGFCNGGCKNGKKGSYCQEGRYNCLFGVFYIFNMDIYT